MELLIGCGHSRVKKIMTPAGGEWRGLVTLDSDPSVKPDVVCDLNENSLPFADESFDEVHAYEVLEHLGNQGDWKFFFKQFDEFARILKILGLLVFTSPSFRSKWLWGDPGHKRYIGPENMIFLNRAQYSQLGDTPMTDYRPFFKSNWQMAHYELHKDEINIMVMQRMPMEEI